MFRACEEKDRGKRGNDNITGNHSNYGQILRLMF